jgi:putative membrane protein
VTDGTRETQHGEAAAAEAASSVPSGAGSDPVAGRSDNAELQRLLQAAETNLLVWIRTCLAMMGFGFVLTRFGFFLREVAEVGHVPVRHSPGYSLVAGTVLILLGVVLLMAAVALHWRLVGRLLRGEQPEVGGRWSLGVVAAVVLAALGMMLAGYIAFIQ